MEYRGKGGFSRGGGRGKGNAGQVWGGGATATWSVQQMEDREWGKASGLLGLRGPARPHAPPHSLGPPQRLGGLPAAGRLLPPGWSCTRHGGLSSFLPGHRPAGANVPFP